MGFFTETMGFPWILGLAAVLTESVGAGLLVAGAGTRLMAIAIGTTMVTAAVTSHLEYGFFMNWYGTQAGEGFEFHILAVALSAALVLGGGGRLSVDHLLFGSDAADDG